MRRANLICVSAGIWTVAEDEPKWQPVGSGVGGVALRSRVVQTLVVSLLTRWPQRRSLAAAVPDVDPLSVDQPFMWVAVTERMAATDSVRSPSPSTSAVSGSVAFRQRTAVLPMTRRLPPTVSL